MSLLLLSVEAAVVAVSDLLIPIVVDISSFFCLLLLTLVLCSGA